MGATSEHFSAAELECKHCGANECKPELLDALEIFRAIVGKPVNINSAYRCPTHNAEVGGAPNSQHVQGIAADVSVAGMSADQLEHAARQIPEIKGIGRAPHQDYLHMDVREQAAQWCYDESGKTCPYYPPTQSI